MSYTEENSGLSAYINFKKRTVYHNVVKELNIPVIIKRSQKRQKSIAILIHPEGKIVVRAPYHTSEMFIYDLIRKREKWIKEKIAALSVARAEAGFEHEWVSGKKILFLGKVYSLDVGTVLVKKGACQLRDQILFVSLTIRGYLKQQEQCKKQVEAWYRQQAEQILNERSLHFAARLGVKPAGIIIRYQKQRWGTCDQHNVIRYNWQIVKAPLCLIDYLVVHELAHIRMKNHSPAFWAIVASMLPDYLERRRALKAFCPH